jgi:hypothetical protein
LEEDAVNGFSIIFGVKNNDGVDADGFFGDAQGSASFNITGLLSPAVIDSVVITQNGVVTNETNFSVGDTVTITVNASDPNNLPLEYVFRRFRQNGFDVTLQDWSATNSLTYTFLEEDAVNGFSIIFGVKNNDGVDADGFFGDAQGSASFNITGLLSPVPTAPTGLGATATSSSSIDLSWTDNSTNETNVVVQRSTTSGSGFATIATLGTNTTSYADASGLSASTTYYYRVYATNGAGDSGFSNEASATTATGASILVSWDENPETVVNRSGGGYKVYYSSNSGFNPGDVGVTEIDVPYSSGVSAPTSVLISLSPGTYYIRIAAYSALNAPGTSGGSASTVTPQITLTAP